MPKPRFTIHALEEPKEPLWPVLKLRPAPPPRWKKIESLDAPELVSWLKRVVGAAAAPIVKALERIG